MRAAHMGREDRPASACRFGDPLDRAVRLRGHISFCRYDKDCLVIAAEIRLRRPGPPKSFRHTRCRTLSASDTLGRIAETRTMTVRMMSLAVKPHSTLAP